MKVALLAKQIAKAEGQPIQLIEESFTAGLLHACGKLVLAARLPKEYGAMLELMKTEGLKLVEAERRIFGATHPEVGAYLLGLWGLPDAIVEAVAFHQYPTHCPVEVFSPLTAVCVADFLTCEELPADVEFSIEASEASNYLQRLGLTDRVEFWRELRSNNDG